MQQVQAADPYQAWEMISLVLVDNAEMTTLNHQYFDKNYPTDVISFRYEHLPGVDEEVSGEIIVNVERAEEEGRRRRGTAHELALYVAHGCDHLSGADDQTPEGQQRMRERELAWLEDPACTAWVDVLLQPDGGSS